MKYLTNSDLIEIIYKENQHMEEFGEYISTEIEELSFNQIIQPSLVEKYKKDTEEMKHVEYFKQILKNGQSMGPLLIDKKNNLVDGVHRFIACEELGIDTLLCIRFSGEQPHMPMK